MDTARFQVCGYGQMRLEPLTLRSPPLRWCHCFVTQLLVPIYVNTNKSRASCVARVPTLVSTLSNCFQYPSVIYWMRLLIFCSFCTFSVCRLIWVPLNRLVTHKCSGNPCKCAVRLFIISFPCLLWVYDVVSHF